MSSQIIRRTAYLSLAEDPGRQVRHELAEAVRTAGADDVGSVLCGAACFLAAAGNLDAAAKTLTLVDENGYGGSARTGASVAAVALDDVLGIGLTWPVDSELRPTSRDRWRIEHWGGPLYGDPAEDLTPRGLFRRGTAAFRDNEPELALEPLKLFVADRPTYNRDWMWSDAMLVLAFALLDTGAEREASVRLRELAGFTRRFSDVLCNAELAHVVVRTGCLSPLFPIDAEELVQAAEDVTVAAAPRPRPQTSGPVEAAAETWSAWLPRLDDGLRPVLADFGTQIDGSFSREPASESQVAELERRLDVRLPPSYRAFLRTSNGFLIAGPDMRAPLLSTDEIGWFRDREPDWVDLWTEEPDEVISDDEYRVYGLHRSEAMVRASYLREALQITEADAGSVWLLVPSVQTPGGECEAWDLSSSDAGAFRWPSFAALVAEALDRVEDHG